MAALRTAALRRAAANFAGFQITWLACVAGAGAGYPLLGPLAAALWLTLHVAWLDSGRGVELRLLAAAAAIGYALDSALALGGAIAFPAHAGPALPTTPWMVALWMAFAATLRHSLNWMRRRYVPGAFAGALFGPLAYAAGERLEAIAVAAQPVAWLAIAAAWALALPLLLWLRERLDAG